MKVSRNWLQNYVSKEIPKGEAFVDLLSMNIFEVEGCEKVGEDNEVYDVKVLADRNAYCLSHRGIAREVAVLISADYKVPEFMNTPVAVSTNLKAPEIKIQSTVCRKYLARKVSGLEVAVSPEWLKDGLEALGQRSINSIVDMTNYVMMDSGQPLHAFDADLVKGNIAVRMAKEGEVVTTLDKKEIVLDAKTLVVADDEGVLAIAGVKGGNRAGVTMSTKNIILESANFAPGEVRKTSVKVNIRNESSKRFENDVPLEFADVGINDLSLLIAEMYPKAEFSPIFSYGKGKDDAKVVETTTDFIRECIGVEIPDEEIISILKKCDMQVEGNLKITAPTYRRDINIPQDLAEEVGRVYGYEKITDAQPVRVESRLKNDKEFTIAEYIRDLLVGIGFNEIIGYALRADGDFVLEHPLSNDKNTLRKTLADSTREYIESNSRYLDLMGIKQAKVFEISRIFPKEGERTVLSLGVINQKGPEKPHVVIANTLKYLTDNGIIVDGSVASKINEITATESKVVFDRKMELCVSGDLDLGKMSIDGDHMLVLNKETKKEIVKFRKISAYPFATRDVAIFAEKDKEKEVYEVIVKTAVESIGEENFVRATLFDVFTKEEKTSYAFRLVFQSQSETLKDEVIDSVMKKINDVVMGKGWVVR
ncbi:MAG: phenylalanine--tRNA ligase subunit beta [bacterium]